MSDDEGPTYKDGDIVWVKLGSSWWPGEVTENAPEDYTSKKPPLAIVKFFNESTYEFVKTPNNIYQYNCARKNEFIRKGMDSLRSHNSHMEKFPGDVSLAEIRTDGNPNILNDPIFAPQKKNSSIIAEVFGSPSPKKTPKENRHSRGKTSKNSANKKQKVTITHRRFLGCDDYESHVRLQYPGKDSERPGSGDESDTEPSTTEPTKNFNCQTCPFNTTRLEVMFFHVQCHIKGISSPVQVKRKQSQKKKKPRVVKRLPSDDERTNSSGGGFFDTDSEEEKPKPKKKKKAMTSPKKPKEKKIQVQEEEEEKTVMDIRTNLLAEWSDSDEGEKPESSTRATSGEVVDKRKPENEKEKPDEDNEKLEGEKEEPRKSTKSEKENQTEKDVKSCFDFDEEEEEDTSIVPTALGRKIPRVIPPTEKRKSTDPDNEDANLPIAEDDENRMEILKVSESLNDSSSCSVSNDADLSKNEDVFNDLMDSTSVPDLPDVPDTTSPQKNFPDSKTVKIPDKKVETVTEVATKLTNPKKRFVKSFEDFELLQNEQRRAQEEEMRKEKAVVVEQMPVAPSPVALSSLVEDNLEEARVVEEIKTIENDKPQVEEATSVEELQESPVNDIEEESPSIIIEEKKEEPEEKKKEPVKENKTVEDAKELVEIFKKVSDSKIEEEEKLDLEINDIKKMDTNVQISKLKCQIMSKMSDDEPETSKLAKNKSPHHRTPRSKILESYRNDKSKEHKSRRSVEEKETIEEKTEHVSKKSKYSKLAEDADSVEKIEEEPVKEEPTKSDIIKEVEAIPEKNSDEEIGKINQIDEYLNDFLFNFPKKADPPPIIVEEEEKKEEIEDKGLNEVHIKYADQEGDDIAIKTNLSNFNNSEEEMSALSTLAKVSQLETIEKPPEVEKVKIPEPKPESELVPIDGNLTVTVSEKDLADGQVEITSSVSPPYKKPVTLTNFSMDFSECNSNSNSDSLIGELEEKPKEIITGKKLPGPNDVFDLEDHIPSQIVDKATKVVQETSPATTSKLLERLTEQKPKENHLSTPKIAKVPTTKDSTKVTKTKFVIKPPTVNKVLKATPTSNKPIILSEKIIKPVKAPEAASGSVSVQKITSKRNLHDPDEIDTFIIQKGAKKDEELQEVEEVPAKKLKKGAEIPKKVTSNATVKKRGKAKILQQTIITPAGEIIQPNVTTTTTTAAAATATTVSTDDNVFDINSMPIVLSDQILTPESIENMPIYLSDSVQSTPEPPPIASKVKTTTIVKKTPIPIQHTPTPMRVLNKSISSPATKLVKTPKILGTVGSKILKHNVFTSGSSKHGKYVIVTQPSGTTTTTSKYTVGKKQALIKRVSGEMGVSSPGTLTKVHNIASTESTGNKIMILTDQQGQQQRVLLTPAQQKMMGYQSAGTKITKTVVKGNIIQKGKDGHMTAVPSSSGLITKTISSSRINSNQTLISSSGHVLTPIHPSQAKGVRIGNKTHVMTTSDRKIQMQSQKVPMKPPQQKTILIKNQHGQTVRKIQGTDDALLDKQVAEQIEAIKASGVLQQKQEILNYKTTPKSAFRRSYAKKVESPKMPLMQKGKETVAPPPLAPISPKKTEPEKQDPKQERALHQLVIQDAMGNQTTITEGQILALPSETLDGQPQSYMLVTLDESGNLTPLNNEALLSLDPNLGLGGDLGNTVLQIDQSALKDETPEVVSQSEVVSTPKSEPEVPPAPPVKEEEKVVVPPEPEVGQEQIVDSSVMQTLGETGQQLIVTGDPIAAQKFLESLTEGNTDLANILANAEGSSILIHADGQQILINTDSDNQMLLSVNNDNMNMPESTEGGGNPIFATQPKNQDILAAALADTDVFQQEQSSQSKVAQLSPSSTLYPMNVGNVLETSLTLNSPIMTPLEVPSNNSKKISDESDILNQVPKNVDLPITITDPTIAHTVSQQQVASLMVNDLQNNLELSLPISDTSMTVTSSEMNSPSFVYSLPSLDADITQKPFNSSMPLLTEDAEEVAEVKLDDVKTTEEDEEKTETKMTSDGSFLDENEGLCTLGGEMCSSLSEPPPDMFDLSAVLSSHQMKTTSTKEDSNEENELKIDDKVGEESVSSESVNPDTASVTETSSPNTMNEDSCEIPVQPEIVTTLKDEGFDSSGIKRSSDEENGMDSKKCKFD